MDRHLVQIVGAPPLEQNKLLDGGKVNLADRGAQVADARLGHTLPDGLQLIGPHPHIDGRGPNALFHCSSRSRLRLRRGRPALWPGDVPPG